MSRREILDLYFLEARSKLLDIAAFMDRLRRAEGEADFRFDSFQHVLKELASDPASGVENVLKNLSDPTGEPLPESPGTPACGAWKSAD